MKIKTAQPDDWQLIQSLNNQVFINDKHHDDDLDMEYPFSERGIKYYKRLANGEYGKCLIAYADGNPAGYIALAVKDFGYRKSKYIEVENIGVDPTYRSQGIGRLLIEEAVKWAKEKNAVKLYVSAYWQNKRAINFYKKNGFYEIALELDKKI
jgi:ribosomal protein S18 acetylase RimI-like enzyme